MIITLILSQFETFCPNFVPGTPITIWATVTKDQAKPFQPEPLIKKKKQSKFMP